MSKTYLHKDIEGKLTKLSDLKLSHLKNIIRLIERRAKEGVTIRFGGGGSLAEDMWYDEDTVYGKEVLRLLHHKDYIQELQGRPDENRK